MLFLFGFLVAPIRCPCAPVPVKAPGLLTGIGCGTMCQLINCPNSLHSTGSVSIVRGSSKSLSQLLPKIMTSLFIAFVFKFFIPLLVLVALIDLLSQTQVQKIQRLSKAGQSQRSIAEQLGITRYKVRLALV